ncbi:MAG: hypothetical protein E6K80_05860, partial [Candidatus Eisenbacteria bacterium]
MGAGVVDAPRLSEGRRVPEARVPDARHGALRRRAPHRGGLDVGARAAGRSQGSAHDRVSGARARAARSRARDRRRPAVKRGGRAVISIRWVVTGVAVALVVASVLSVGAVAERTMRRTLSREIETRLLLEARNLALTSSGALLSEFPELTLVPVVKKMQAERPELAFVVVVDHLGRIQGHADPRRLDQPYAPPADLAPTPSAMALQPGERLLADGRLLVVESPVSYPKGPLLGRAVVAMRRDYVEAAVSAGRRSQFLFLGGLLLAAVTMVLVLLGGLLRPIA